jgi:hypothetical protein
MDGPDAMPRNFYILRDERDWWAVSDQPFLPESGRSFRSPNEAFDHLRNLISKEGLDMGRPIPEGLGFRVEAIEPGEVEGERRPMLYSPDALSFIEIIRDKLGQLLKRKALDLAKRSGRNLVTDDDVWDVLVDMHLLHIVAESDEEDGDGR